MFMSQSRPARLGPDHYIAGMTVGRVPWRLWNRKSLLAAVLSPLAAPFERTSRRAVDVFIREKADPGHHDNPSCLRLAFTTASWSAARAASISSMWSYAYAKAS
jgi:hypothetical protein